MLDRPIIAATRSDEDFFASLGTASSMIFDLSPDILTVSAKIRRAHEAGKKLYLHMDLARGIGRDESGLRFLHRLGADGILTTKAALVKEARELGLETVQRIFMLDSRSVETAMDSIRASRPDRIEIMPGLLPKVIRKIKTLTVVPLIVGGLIETPAEVVEALTAGADAVSTGRRDLWDWRPD